ncbi:MAG: helicase HerA domain-containing protein, partial [Syntrophales bacterium]
MQTIDLSDPRNVIEVLRKGKMLDHPGVAAHVRFALATNDYSQLMGFLKANPAIIATALNNIAAEEFEKSLSPFRPYPTIKEVNEYLTGPLTFGYVNPARSMFGILWDILCLPILCAGRTGSGKSSLIKSMISKIISMQLPFNILIPDLKKEYRHLCTDGTNLKVLMQDRIMLNPLQVPAWCTRIEDHVVAFSKCFVSENYLVGTSENVLIDLVDSLYRSRGIYAESKNYPTLKDLYDLVTRSLSKAKSFRWMDVLLWLQNRLRPYVLCDSFNCQIGIPFETFQKENLVLEMDTRFTDRMYNFTIATIANQLYMHNKAKDIGGTIKHWWVVDEARILFNAHRDVSAFGESVLTEILTKSRAYGISFLLASQESASFNSVMRSLSFLKIAFPLSDCADLDFIKASFGLTEEQKDALFELPAYGTAVVRYGG